MTENKQRTALVTGGNRGIGFAICEGLAKEGFNVLLGSRDIEAGRAAANKIGGSVTAVELDLSSEHTLTTHIESIVEHHASIDVLVNNAGILDRNSFLDIDNEIFNMALRVNLQAPQELIRHLLPAMIKRGYGRIVNVTSGWGSFGEGLTGPVSYAVSKTALNALTLSISQTVPDAIKINAMCPGWVRTRMGGDNASRSPEEGAQTALWLSSLPDGGPSGGFFRDKKPIAW